MPVIFVFGRMDHALPGLLVARRRRMGDERIEKVAHAEIPQGRAEIDRRQMAFEKGLAVETVAEVAHQFHFVAPGRQLRRREQGGEQRIIGTGHHLSGRVFVQPAHPRRIEVIGAGKIPAQADGPHHGGNRQRQALFNLVQKVKRLAGFAVHLVDEGDDRNVAQAADFEELAGARFDALGAVDHHDGRINRRQRAVGVFGKVLVARRIQQVEDAAAIFKGHHRGDDRNAARPLDRHPVRARAPPVALGAHLSGKLDGAAEQQELFGERGLAGVRMGNDGEGPPARNLGSYLIGHGNSNWFEVKPLPSGSYGD